MKSWYEVIPGSRPTKCVLGCRADVGVVGALLACSGSSSSGGGGGGNGALDLGPNSNCALCNGNVAVASSSESGGGGISEVLKVSDEGFAPFPLTG